MLKVSACVCWYILRRLSRSLLSMNTVCSSELGESHGKVSPPEPGSTHTHRGGSTVAGGGQNPAAFSYLWPIKSHVIWWLTLMGNG